MNNQNTIQLLPMSGRCQAGSAAFVISLCALLAGCAQITPMAVRGAIVVTSTASVDASPPFESANLEARISSSSWIAIRALPWPDQKQTANAGYGPAAKADFWSIYKSGGTEVYCINDFTGAEARKKGIGLRKLNIEHAVPADRISDALGYDDRDCRHRRNASKDPNDACRYAIADLHNMWPSFSKVNSSRGKSRYSEFVGEAVNRSFTEFCPDYERAKADNEIFVEPTRASQGNVARSLIYMSMVYGIPLDTAIDDLDRLLEWNRIDPPDEEERRREQAIREIQHTWNPLVMAK